LNLLQINSIIDVAVHIEIYYPAVFDKFINMESQEIIVFKLCFNL